MSSEAVQKWRENCKLNLIKACGGKCVKCGYDKCKASLCFHHLDPNTKYKSIAHMLRHPTKIELIIKEANKCILLCANCHAELHSNMWDIDNISIPTYNFSYFIKTIPEKLKNKCKLCNKITTNSHFCSRQCSGIFSRKIK